MTCLKPCVFMMALNCASSILGYSQACHPQLGFANSHSGNSGLIVNLRCDFEKCRKWECCCNMGILHQTATTPVEGEKPIVPVVEISGANDGIHENESKGFHKNVFLLSSEFSTFLYLTFGE